ncbi:MAG: lysophospholipid acyltransferase family protein [Desulfobacula sp.]|nr:lysophospholipid acyltransferase family protein [Desulfobacula sp.]
MTPNILLKQSIVRFILSWFGNIVLFILRWKVKGRLPDAKKFVMIAAPHSSNWDFIIFMMVVFKFKIPIHWMGKHTMFVWPFKGLLKRLGGIPVDRSVKTDTVQLMVDVFAKTTKFILTIAPSGTRSKTKKWRSGFYHIAHQSKVPIVCGYIDYKNKITGFGPTFFPTGDKESDMISIKHFYKPFSGKDAIKF